MPAIAVTQATEGTPTTSKSKDDSMNICNSRKGNNSISISIDVNRAELLEFGFWAFIPYL